MIREVTQQEKNRTRQFWEEVFTEDSMSFLDYYYTEKIKDNKILVEEREGRIVAMLQRNPYCLQFAGRRAASDYIVGVATAADCRRQGLMRSLMETSLLRMAEEGMPFCFLMPEREEYYLPFAFTYIYDDCQYHLNQEGLALQKIPLNGSGEVRAAQIKEVSRWMQSYLEKRYQVFAVRDEAYVSRLFKELESEAGGMFFLKDDNGKICGIYEEWGIQKKEQRMLFCEEQFLAPCPERKPAIMGRITDLAGFVRDVCLDQTSKEEKRELLLSVTDREIPQNHGLWKWTIRRDGSTMERAESAEKGAFPEGKAESKRKGDKAEGNAEEKALPAHIVEVTIQELCRWLFGYGDDCPQWLSGVRAYEGVFLDEIV